MHNWDISQIVNVFVRFKQREGVWSVKSLKFGSDIIRNYLNVVIGTDVLVIRGGELLVMNRSVEPSGQCQKCRVSQTDSVG